MKKQEQIISLYKSGMRPAAIAAKVGVSRQRVGQVLETYPKYLPLQTVIAQRRVRVKHMNIAALSNEAIAKALGVSTETIKKDLVFLGVSQTRIDAINERRKKVRAMREAKLSNTAIAKGLGVPLGVIQNDLARLGFPRRARSSADEVAARRATVIAMREKGLGMREIAQQMSLPLSTIQTYVESCRLREKAMVKRRKKVQSMREQGMTLRAIAASLGVPLGTVSNDMKALGLVAPRKTNYTIEGES